MSTSDRAKRVSPAMVRALTCAPRGRVWAPRPATVNALIARGFATKDWLHTPEGLALRAKYIKVPASAEFSTVAP